MGQDDGVARDRVIAEATRHALQGDLRRAWRRLAGGVLLVVLGCAVAAGSAGLPFFGIGLLAIGGSLGLLLIPLGIAVLAGAAYTISSGRRRLRELAERTALPVARVRPGRPTP
jgi:hypothetical protein